MSRRLVSKAALESNQSISAFARVMMPSESDEPILAPGVRRAVYQWLNEMRYEDDLAEVGLEPQRSVFFCGPPGCGKTTLAHHVAARLGLPMLLVEMPAIRSQYIGETGRNLVQFFRAAEAVEGGAVIFLDEFDSLGQRRTSGGKTGASQENAAIVNALLQMIDRYPGIVVAATNREDTIDPALHRRFQMQLVVDLPDEDARFAILKRYLAPFELAEESLDILAGVTGGATPALLERMMKGIKRAMVLGPRIGLAMDAGSVLKQLTSSIRPAPGMDVPPLWHQVEDVANALAWPPSRP